mgnify:FL=1
MSYLGCLSGDCPHDKQEECDKAIRDHCSRLERVEELAGVVASRPFYISETFCKHREGARVEGCPACAILPLLVDVVEVCEACGNTGAPYKHTRTLASGGVKLDMTVCLECGHREVID